jgi:hypothetical protein
MRRRIGVSVMPLETRREAIFGLWPRPYRWVVLGASTGINVLAWGVRSTFALFYVALLNEFAWDRGSTALGYSLSGYASSSSRRSPAGCPTVGGRGRS